MRILIVIETRRRDDALLILETAGFAPEGPEEAATDAERFEVAGELPEKSLPQLQAIDGVLDWKVLSAKEDPPPRPPWPWNQNPETD